MTSKEALKKICDYLFYQDSNSFNYTVFAEGYGVIKTELEILEILKHNLFVEKGTGRWKGIEVISCSLGSEHSGKDFEKIKEWLKDEK